MNITVRDIIVSLLGIVLAVLGNMYDMHGLSFAGGVFLGATAFYLGWKFDEWTGSGL